MPCSAQPVRCTSCFASPPSCSPRGGPALIKASSCAPPRPQCLAPPNHPQPTMEPAARSQVLSEWRAAGPPRLPTRSRIIHLRVLAPHSHSHPAAPAASSQHVIHWNRSGNGFMVPNLNGFENLALPAYYKHKCVALLRACALAPVWCPPCCAAPLPQALRWWGQLQAGCAVCARRALLAVPCSPARRRCPQARA